MRGVHEERSVNGGENCERLACTHKLMGGDGARGSGFDSWQPMQQPFVWLVTSDDGRVLEAAQHPTPPC